VHSRMTASKPANEFMSVHASHLHVREDNIEGFLTAKGHRVKGVRRLRNLISRPREMQREKRADRGLIVDDQNMGQIFVLFYKMWRISTVYSN